ncbi:uncharacterized protein RHIMIDRAFT_251733 [Rhizopus microsporus ATCC 52813]|uniref:Uncharacterized protein n=1 Tax=Rhizopus microsporus ATCC 52813 TaxID=1340429 RepID=A0A2G4SVL3_RHIZD|nr:uncharacterized protein RHIMIDRAFT_251733 [Rhizopus microsporus ATCC 52813]PHZ12821.1 hypothetical protein RHIMIDRAFT_251733 [Rhizopus microsporus ATCC 52813]
MTLFASKGKAQQRESDLSYKVDAIFIKSSSPVDRGFPSLFVQMQTSLFKNTAFEASDDDFQEAPLLRKDKNIHTTLKAAKEDTSAPGPSNVVTSNKSPMSTVNKDTSVQDVLPAPITSTSCTSASIKSSKKYQDKVDKTETLKKEKEKNKTTANEQNNKLRPMDKSKAKLPRPKDTVEKTFVIKTSLANTCKYPKFVTLIQENGEELPVTTPNLFYNIFSTFVGQEKHAFDSIKKSFMAFCESTSLTEPDLDKYASKGYMTIISPKANQYEALVRNYVCSTYEDRTLRRIINVLSEKASFYFCGDTVSVKQRKSLAKHIFQQKINPKFAWSFTVDRIERHETILNSFLTFWSTYDASNDTDVPSEANLYTKPQCYMKWLHSIQKEMKQKKSIQEMKSQDRTSGSYVHRKLQELPFVKKLSTSKYRSLKGNTLTAIDSNKSLKIASKLKDIDKMDAATVQTFIKTVQARIQDKTFIPLRHTDHRESRIFFFSCTRLMLKRSEDLFSNLKT